MVAVIEFVFFVVSALLTVIVWLVIASAIATWLIAFDVINTRNRVVYHIVRFLDAVTQPLLRPFRRIVPLMGGIDITPVMLIIIIYGIQRYLLPALEVELIHLAAPQAVILGP